MKAITLWQPYATLLASGIKEYETRSWAIKHRGPILIHAAKKSFKEVFPILEFNTLKVLFEYFGTNDEIRNNQFEYGCIVGYANLIDCIEMSEKLICQQTSREIVVGDWRPGRYAWKMLEPILFKNPIPCKGFQGIWNYDGELPEIN